MMPVMKPSAALLLPALFLLTGCGSGDDDKRTTASDDRDIAMVEKAQMQLPPVQSVQPQPITLAESQAHNLFGAGCVFVPQADATDPILVTNTQRAAVKLDGKVQLLASDTGGEAMPLGTWAHYVGKTHSLTIGKAAGEGADAGEGGTRWDGTVTIRDADDRIAWRGDGLLECGA